jgi:hypothetical protein
MHAYVWRDVAVFALCLTMLFLGQRAERIEVTCVNSLMLACTACEKYLVPHGDGNMMASFVYLKDLEVLMHDVGTIGPAPTV